MGTVDAAVAAATVDVFDNGGDGVCVLVFSSQSNVASTARSATATVSAATAFNMASDTAAATARSATATVLAATAFNTASDTAAAGFWLSSFSSL